LWEKPAKGSATPGGARRFACQPGCTRCCEVPGYVYFTEEDIERAARFLGLTPAEFERRYIYRTRHLRRMRKPSRGQCHFLEAGGCRIHPVKPAQCRLFPFWPELLASRRAWRETARWCPGIGQGELIPIRAAREWVSAGETAGPR